MCYEPDLYLADEKQKLRENDVPSHRTEQTLCFKMCLFKGSLLHCNQTENLLLNSNCIYRLFVIVVANK